MQQGFSTFPSFVQTWKTRYFVEFLLQHLWDDQHFFKTILGPPWWLSGEESTCQYRRHGFDPWSRKSPYAKEQLGPCSTIPELALWSLEATVLSPVRHLLKPRAREPVLGNKRRPAVRSAHAARSPRDARGLHGGGAPLTATGEKLHSCEAPAQPEINQSIKLFLKVILKMVSTLNIFQHFWKCVLKCHWSFHFWYVFCLASKTRVLNLRNGKGSSHLKTKFPEVVCILAEKSRLLTPNNNQECSRKE